MEIPIEEARKEGNIRDVGLLVIDTITDEGASNGMYDKDNQVQSHAPNNDRQWTINVK